MNNWRESMKARTREGTKARRRERKMKEYETT